MQKKGKEREDRVPDRDMRSAHARRIQGEGWRGAVVITNGSSWHGEGSGWVGENKGGLEKSAGGWKKRRRGGGGLEKSKGIWRKSKGVWRNSYTHTHT